MDLATLFEFLKAFFFGIVEGITEWLPISSTGHMMLLNQFVTLDVSPAFYDVFLVVIQLGAIMAVLILYFHKLNPFSSKKTEEQKKLTWGIWAKVVVGSIPAAIVGLALDNWMEENVMNNADVAYIVVSCALIFYGVLFIIIELNNRRRLRAIREAESAGAAGQPTFGGAGELPVAPAESWLDEAPAKQPAAGQFRGKHSPEAVNALRASMGLEPLVVSAPSSRFDDEVIDGQGANGELADNQRQSHDSLTPQGVQGGITAAFAAADEQVAAERPFDPYVDIADDPDDASNAVSKVTNFGELGFGRAFLIGIFQSLAIVPGTSRSGSIIIGSMLLGCSRTVATEFAFFLAIPIMFGWSLLKFFKHGFAYTGTEWAIFAIGIVTAFVVSILSIKFLMSYIKKNDFTAFGVYRIILGALVLLFFGSQAAGLFF